MKLTTIIVAAVIIVIVDGGCSEADPTVQTIEQSLRELPNRIKDPRPYTWEFGSALGDMIYRLPDVNLRRKYQVRFEDAVLAINFDTSDYDRCSRQFDAFCDVADSCACGMDRWHEAECLVESVRLKLRLLNRMKRESLAAESRRNVEVASRPGLHANPFSYADSVKMKLDEKAERFEKHFNERGEELEEAQCAAIRKEFARIMGRPLRTNEEIAHDRQRLIDEARRRQEAERGDDVRVDIESL